jgi:hypothetical protein
MLFISAFALLSNAGQAQQAVEQGNYRIHYNAIQTSELPAPVMQAYGIRRSPNRALVNIAILDISGEQPDPVRALVTASARNLVGQRRTIEMREVDEAGEAIYYLGEVRVNNRETLEFSISARVSGQTRPLEFKFSQMFYTQ